MTEPFLIGESMNGGYGNGADILHGCTIAVDPGQIAVIVGPNGAGKSTAMKAVFGMLRIRAAGLALTALVALTLPALADDECAYISRHFELCDAGTDWEGGEWEQYGDGATLHLGPLAFDFFEDWAGRHKGEAASVEAALEDVVADKNDDEVSVVHLRDSFATDTLTLARHVETVTFGKASPILRTIMIAEAGGQRIYLSLTAPADFPMDEMDSRAHEVARLVRIQKEGQ